eukprot:COSAG01_NODE_1318_length_10746_cov_96.891425_12_plen_83_part_00
MCARTHGILLVLPMPLAIGGWQPEVSGFRCADVALVRSDHRVWADGAYRFVDLLPEVRASTFTPAARPRVWLTEAGATAGYS